MVKLTQIQAGQLLDLLQTVNQRVAVDKQLAGSFRHIQIILKELIDGKQGLLIQRINGILLENFSQIDLAQGVRLNRKCYRISREDRYLRTISATLNTIAWSN